MSNQNCISVNWTGSPKSGHDLGLLNLINCSTIKSQIVILPFTYLAMLWNSC